MSSDENNSSSVEVGLPVLLPPHLTENFEKADAQLSEMYGVSPGVTALIRLWLACGTSSRIRTEFEFAVLDIKRRDLNPNEEDYLNEDTF